jgi:3-isopropylmalate/(R)-2-methylmalate dehydratase small subunit
MEIAALVIRGAGISVVVAKSFSRTFYRNAINNGILVVAIDTAGIEENDRIEIEPLLEKIIVKVNGTVFGQAPPITGAMMNIVHCGGIVEYMKKYGNFSGDC